jgi:murein lipoprotein
MYSTLKKATLISMLVVFAGLSGCASTTEMDQMRADIKTANDKADKAAAEAAAASRAAAEAKAAAEAARAAAEAARASSEATDAKIDRMFKKSMYK